MINTDWAWLSGFIDGDGCFTCAVWEKVPNGIPTITIAPRIIISQAEQNRYILDYIVQKTGVGKVYIKKEISNSFNSQEQGMYTISRLDDIRYICENISPYIVHKKLQCEMMLELVNIRLQGKIGINKWNRERIPLENTLRCAELGLSLNPYATNGRNSRHNGKERTIEYWKVRIPEIYLLADEMIYKRKFDKYIELICSTCNRTFNRLKCNIRKGTKNHYCSMECKK